ncbi:hypothetical protein QJS10_CPB15g01000 [Acorus calamus]|uniref:DUF4283 domain-containing protein n=1 Tax=Acorus calamus TaxID=4465 RepID=A0AAV9D7I2_ACOCL|nr:hypothetical protein QJS10_CPB15g01000 [Acorus calamus]
MLGLLWSALLLTHLLTRMPSPLPHKGKAIADSSPQVLVESSLKGLLPTPAPSQRGVAQSSRKSKVPRHEGPRPRRHINVLSPEVNEEAKLWSSLFTASSSNSFQPANSMDFFQPHMDGGQKVAIIEEEEAVEAEESWGHILVGYVWGKNHAYTPFVQFLHRLWNPKGVFTLSMQE